MEFSICDFRFLIELQVAESDFVFVFAIGNQKSKIKNPLGGMMKRFFFATMMASLAIPMLCAAEPAPANKSVAQAPSKPYSRPPRANPARPPAPNTDRTAPPISDTATRRDPTEAQGELRQLLATEPTKKDAAAPAPVLPPLSVRGRIVGTLAPPTVLLSLGGDQFLTARPGRQYLISNNSQNPITLEVLSIGPDGVEIELQPLDRRLVLP